MEPIALTDLAVIGAQIGRRPRGVLGIPVRCDYGYPQVVRVRPVIGDEPFPTLYWLTCPFLSRRIDHLEANGWVARLEARLAEDATLQVAMGRAHQRYIKARAALLKPAEREQLHKSGRAAALLERGIGGIADRRWLKCLHLHAAHALVDDNPVGATVLDMLEERQCSSDAVICESLGPSAGVPPVDR